MKLLSVSILASTVLAVPLNYAGSKDFAFVEEDGSTPQIYYPKWYYRQPADTAAKPAAKPAAPAAESLDCVQRDEEEEEKKGRKERSPNEKEEEKKEKNEKSPNEEVVDPLRPERTKDGVLCTKFRKNELKDVPEECIEPIFCDILVRDTWHKCENFVEKKDWTKEYLLGANLTMPCLQQTVCTLQSFYKFFDNDYSWEHKD